MLGLKTSLQRAGRAKRVAINWRSISIALASMEILFVRRITLQVLTACEWPMSAVQPTFECPGDGVFERPLLAELGRPPPSAHDRHRSTRNGSSVHVDLVAVFELLRPLECPLRRPTQDAGKRTLAGCGAFDLGLPPSPAHRRDKGKSTKPSTLA